MIKSIYAIKDSWISELSSSINFGHDEILELKKEFNNTDSSSMVHGVSRVLLQFDLNSISESVASGDITSPKYFLKLYATEASDLDAKYTLSTFPISQSWEEGLGKYLDSPETKKGVTWKRRDQEVYGTEWTDLGKPGQLSSGSRNMASGSESNQSGSAGGGVWYTGSGYECTQSFSYSTPDIEMDVTTIVNKWLDSTIINNGFILTRSGSMSPIGEENDESRQNLKFFSRHTHTIYPPKLEVRWDDHVHASGSLTSMNITGDIDNYVYVKGIRPQYRETETVRFRVGARERNLAKTFSTSVATTSGSYIPERSGSYSIVDLVTNETLIPFSDYTYLSCDDTYGSYFNLDLNTFQPNRIYKIMLKVTYQDNQTVIYDDDSFQFKVVK
tara:strand:+ start:127 stop:1287 length:1161 start_codon:yes stop_codon:yes gene_type:complete